MQQMHDCINERRVKVAIENPLSLGDHASQTFHWCCHSRKSAAEILQDLARESAVSDECRWEGVDGNVCEKHMFCEQRVVDEPGENHLIANTERIGEIFKVSLSFAAT
jgi:hypothetical protein